MKPTRTRVGVVVLVCGLACSVSSAQMAVGAARDNNILVPNSPTQISPTTVYLRSATIDTRDANVAPADLVARQGDAARAVIQLDGPITEARRTALENAGVKLGSYLPSNAFIVDMTGADADEVAGLGFVRWSDAYQNAWKLDPDLGNRQFVTPERQQLQAAGKAAVVITLFEGGDEQAVMQTVRALDANARVWSSEDIAENRVLTVEMSSDQVVRLSELDDVQYVEPASEITYRNNTNTWIVQSNVSNQTPLWDAGLRGQGQYLGVIDGAVNISHCSFSDPGGNPPGPSHRKVEAANTSGSSSHGTHVAGTALGDNGVDGPLRGIAYEARLVFNTIPSFTESGILQRLNLHASQGATVHTNSWGDDGTTAYNSLCRGFDAFQYQNEDHFVCLAVTNTSSLKNPENAKNMLSCGASQDTPNQGNFCSGGTGPTADGRRKPELFAPGCSTVSASSSSSCGTQSSTGTSMATPAIAGTASLVRQYYTEGFYPGGLANPSDAITPSGALIKATLLNSGADMTGIGGYPSNGEGWGRVLADNAVYLDGDTRKLVIEDVRNADGMTTGEFIELPVNVTGSGENLRITVVWTEPPATAGAGFAQVNDLDLTVMSPSGTTYLGNVFSGGLSTTGGSKDDRNNVEQVHVASPEAGTWTVRIDAAAINEGSQGFAMVATGEVESGPASLRLLAGGTPAPTITLPGETSTFSVVVNPGDDTPVGTPTLRYRFDGGAFLSTATTPLGGDEYEATIPAPDCADTPQFYVEAEGVTTGVVTYPSAGASDPFELIVGEEIVPYEDDMSANLGWTVNAEGTDTATTGQWNRMDPQGTTAQPETANSPVFCWVTNGIAGASVGANDVDNGATTLYSPAIDLSGTSDPTLGYYRWFSNDAGSAPNSDVFTVEISETGAAPWTTVEVVGPTGPGTSGGWFYHEFRVLDFVGSLTPTTKLKFIASDLGSGSIVEAAIDDIRVGEYVCIDTGCPADIATTGRGGPDGVVDLADLLFYVNLWETKDPQADLTTTGSSEGDPSYGQPDSNVDLSDLLYYVNIWEDGLVECP